MSQKSLVNKLLNTIKILPKSLDTRAFKPLMFYSQVSLLDGKPILFWKKIILDAEHINYYHLLTPFHGLNDFI